MSDELKELLEKMAKECDQRIKEIDVRILGLREARAYEVRQGNEYREKLDQLKG